MTRVPPKRKRLSQTNQFKIALLELQMGKKSRLSKIKKFKNFLHVARKMLFKTSETTKIQPIGYQRIQKSYVGHQEAKLDTTSMSKIVNSRPMDDHQPTPLRQ